MKDPIALAQKFINSGNPKMVKMGEELLKKHQPQESKQDEFITTIHRTDTASSNAPRKVYDEQGNIIGTRMVRQPIKGIQNEWQDTEKDLGSDKHNEELKQFTKRVPRERKAPKLKRVKCYNCGKEEEVLPIHATGQFYRCNTCFKPPR